MSDEELASVIARTAELAAQKRQRNSPKSAEIRARADAPDPDGLPTIPLPFIRPAGLYPLETDG